MNGENSIFVPTLKNYERADFNLRHYLQTRAIGGSTGYSDWSDPVSHMAL